MILTVCPNSALDVILFIDEWTPGQPIRTNRVVNCVGGKGLDSSVVLSQLGIKTTAIACFAGHMGKQLYDLVDDYGIHTDAVWLDGENRVSYVVADAKNKHHTHIITGEMVMSAEHKQLILKKFHHNIQQAHWVILAGSLPTSIEPDFYAQLIKIANQVGVPSLIDSQKQFMIAAIDEKPTIIKMNWEEFEWTFGCKAETFEDLVVISRQVKADRDLMNMVLTLSTEGILALTEEGDYLAKAPLQEPVNAAGAGDAVSSALVWRLSLNENWKSSLTWAAAISAATVLTERTGDLNQEDIDRILPMVRIEELT